MKLYIVIVDYKDPQSFNSQFLMDVIDSIGQNLRLMSKTFLLRSDASAVDIRNEIGQSDVDISNIFVAECSSPSAWKGLLSDNSDIKKMLRDEY